VIPRQIESLVQKYLATFRPDKRRAIVILGPRQVGKTTLMRKLFDPARTDVKWVNGESAADREQLAVLNPENLKHALSGATTVVIDEAQRIDSIGLVVKMLVDKYPEIQILVTGSSALELAHGIYESMTGRAWNLSMYPLSFEEMSAQSGFLDELKRLPIRLQYGYYPQVVTELEQEQKILANLCEGSLYKDILAYQQVRKPDLVVKLLRALALQVGNEVTYSEVGQLINSDPETVERYVELLEKAFVIFRLHSLSRNMRNEIKRSRKIYFYDLGIRNSLIQNFIPLALRADTGGLWENFCIVERMKTLAYHEKFVNRYFWRTHTQKEIDYIEEYEGKLHAYEFKWNPKAKAKNPKAFLEAYPGSEYKVITPKNFEEFVMFQDEKK
jgi:uncharacterized protein